MGGATVFASGGLRGHFVKCPLKNPPKLSSSWRVESIQWVRHEKHAPFL
jgi:hypothetical protein